MTQLSKMDKDKFGPKVIDYGKPGTGKTAFWMTLGSSCLYLDCDRGFRTGLTMQDEWTTERGKVELIECWETNPRQATAFSKTESAIQDAANKSATGKFPYQVMVVDSFSALAENCMRHVLQANGKLGKQPELQHWSVMYNLLAGVLNNIRSMSETVVMPMHQEIHEVDGVNIIELFVPGKKLINRITPYFDEIVHSRIKNGAAGKVKYVLIGRGTHALPVRSRSNIPPEYDKSGGAKEYLKLMGYAIDKTEEGDK